MLYSNERKEIVDKVPASETMLYYFIYMISSHQHTFLMSGNTQLLKTTLIRDPVGYLCSGGLTLF